MTTMVRPDKQEIKAPPSYGTLDDLRREPRTAEAEIGGKLYRFRELFQGEIENVTMATQREEIGPDGKEVRKYDYRGNQARWIAHSWIQPNGDQMFQKPMEQYGVINELPRETVTAMFKVVDKLNGLTPEARDELGKESGRTPASTGGSS